MTTPKPVTAYAAVHDDENTLDIMRIGMRPPKFAPAKGWAIIPVTIIPTEQYEAMVASLGELVAAMRRYEGDVAGDADQPTEHREMMERAEGILSALKEQDHG